MENLKPIYIKEAEYKKCSEVSEFVKTYKDALLSEMDYLKENGGRHQKIYEGKKIYFTGDSYIYSFEAETDLYLPDDLPITLFVNDSSFEANVEFCDGFILFISVGEDIGADVYEAEFAAETWKLLETLIDSLENLSDKHSDITDKLITENYENLVENKDNIYSGQDKAIDLATKQPITFIWGPPGTGKTETLANIAIEHMKKAHRVLMVSYSNISVDGAILRVNKLYENCKPGTLIRYGIPRTKELIDNRILTGYKYAIYKYPELFIEQNELLDEKKTLSRYSKRYYDVVTRLSEITEIINIEQAKAVFGASFVATTITKAIMSDTISKSHFDVVIFDEASMAYIPQIIVSSKFATKHFVCMGDFKQLPPIVQSDKTSILNADIFQYCGISKAINEGKKHKWLCMLDTQYRMHPQIAENASNMIYNGLLKSGNNMLGLRESIVNDSPLLGSAVCFADLSEIMAVCNSTPDNSRINILSAMVSLVLAIKAAENYDVGIITPYRSQAKLIYSMIKDIELANCLSHSITTATVHQFQGSEKDIIIYDAVDSYHAKTLSVLMLTKYNGLCDRLFNVALTRARGKFIGVVNYSFFESRGYKNAYMFGRLMQNIKQTDSRLYGDSLLSELSISKDILLQSQEFDKITNKFVEDIISAKRNINIDIPGKISDNYIKIVLDELIKADKKGVRVVIRAASKNYIPAELLRYTFENYTVINPISIIDEKIVWYGAPISEADIILGNNIKKVNYRPVFRFLGKNAVKSFVSMLAMNEISEKSREELPKKETTFATFIKSNVPCPGCGVKSAMISKSKSNNYFIGFKCWRKCGYQKVNTYGIVSEYLINIKKKCPQCEGNLKADFINKSLTIRCENDHTFNIDEI